MADEKDDKKVKHEAPVLSKEDIGLIRKQIIEQIHAELKLGVRPMMQTGYVQSEGKNYGSYSRA